MNLNPTFVSILRNIRGLLYLSPGDWDAEIVSWLKKKYRYRMIGLAPTLLLEFSEKRDLFAKPPFKILAYPSDTLHLFAEKIGENLPKDIVESVILASCYVTPIVTNSKGLKRLDNLSIYRVLSEKVLPENEIIRHLRIAGYTILDSHEQVCWEAYNKIVESCKRKIDLKNVVNQLLKKRTLLAEKDSKRYWRFKSSTGKPVLIYLDTLKCLENIDICNLVRDESLALAFGIVPAIKVEVSS
ncbi:MAG: hypothetical protein DRJ38_07360 [Thermoprotei archaeon]|nr:MAG: hypothetical protein DRJ38_07360 [Thermoprotei archaeon]